MSNFQVSMLFVLGVFVGFIFGAIMVHIKRVGTLEVNQYDDSNRTTWRFIYEMSLEDVEKMKKIAFNVHTTKNPGGPPSQK